MNFAQAITVYTCDCGWEGEKPDSNEYADYCPNCGNECTGTGCRDAEWVSVALYRVGRAWGGPEEGGWYYREGDRIDSTLRCFHSADEAAAYMQELTSRIVVGDQSPEFWFEKVAPEHFPSQRPHYC